MLPETPRFLVFSGQKDLAREVLTCIRTNEATPEEIEQEYREMIIATQDRKSNSPLRLITIILGQSGDSGSHFGRRAWLCVFLQIMASWTGITVCFLFG